MTYSTISHPSEYNKHSEKKKILPSLLLITSDKKANEAKLC